MKILTFPLGAMRTNCYFIADTAANEAAVIDPAYDCDYIAARLSQYNLKIKCIILTHAHFDHMMALGELRQRTGAPLFIHEADAESLLYPERTYMKQYALRKSGEEPADRLLSDGDEIIIGSEAVTVLHTPGHTPGSICLAAGRDIITGDTLFREDVGRCDLYGGDHDALMKSLARLSALDGDYKLHPGHGSSTTLQHERENNEDMLMFNQS